MKKRSRIIFIIVISTLTTLCLIAGFCREGLLVIGTAVSPTTRTVIIDAGHGGVDGGTTSVLGDKESEINLNIAFKLQAVMGFCGIPSIMIRTEDISIHSEDAKSVHEKKVSDLKNRLKIIDTASNPLLISIHQNSFTSGKYTGAQVFYADTDGSAELAELTQELLRQSLNPDNKRAAKKIANTLFLMNRVKCPAVLVECGFLSNQDEAALLKDEAYQTKIAVTIAAAYIQYEESANEG